MPPKSYTLAAVAAAALIGCQSNRQLKPAPPPQPPGPANRSGPTRAPSNPPNPAPSTPATPAATPPAAPPSAAPAKPGSPLSHTETDSGLIIEDLVLGTGREAGKFDTVKVNYIGTLADGKEFDNTYTRKEPLVANLATQVIKGWQEGITGMKIGGKRRLIVPPELGYGHRGFPPSIPPDSMLIFEIELVDIVK